ncbi:MAG: class I SAM-dependent methyltransferase [Burkholderiales bacterium]
MSSPAAHGTGQPSAWVERWAHHLPPGASVLDVACGAGRHVRWCAARGLRVTGVDRDAAALQPLRELAEVAEVIEADIEAGPWPLAGRQFDLVVVTNYLWRPLLATLVASVAPGGWLLYETFAQGNELYGRPSRPDFLLAPGELLDSVRGALHVVGYEHGYLAAPERMVQRIAAVRCAPQDALDRYRL